MIGALLELLLPDNRNDENTNGQLMFAYFLEHHPRVRKNACMPIEDSRLCYLSRSAVQYQDEKK